MAPRKIRVPSEIKPLASVESSEAPDPVMDAPVVQPTAPTPVVAPIIKTIAPAPKGKGFMERYIKVVAITDSEGLYGHSRYVIKQGQTYSFERDLAKWLMETGRAK